MKSPPPARGSPASRHGVRGLLPPTARGPLGVRGLPPPPARGSPASRHGVRGEAPSVPTSPNSLHSQAPPLPLLSRQPPEKQAFRGVCPHPSLIFCTLLPLLGTLATIPPPSFLSNSTIETMSAIRRVLLMMRVVLQQLRRSSSLSAQRREFSSKTSPLLHPQPHRSVARFRFSF